MRWGPRWSLCEKGPEAHAVGASFALVPKRMTLSPMWRGPRWSPKRWRPARPCGEGASFAKAKEAPSPHTVGGLGFPKAKEAPSPTRWGPPGPKAKEAPTACGEGASVWSQSEGPPPTRWGPR